MPNYDFSRPINLNNLPAVIQNQMQQDPSLVVPGSPPIFGQDIVPHFYTSTGYVGSAARAYPIEDEATRNSVENATRMRTECGIMECLEARQRATALLKWHVVPEDDRSEAQRKLCNIITRLIERTPRFVEYRRCLLEALWYGKYAVVNTFASKRIGGKYRTVIGEWQPRHGDKLMFRYNDNTYRYEQGQLGIRVHANFGVDKLPQLAHMNEQQRRTKIEPTQYGLVYWFNKYERETLVVHRHLVEDGPWHDPRMMGRVMGVGIRDRIYWTWYAMQALLQDLLTYASRAALGVRLWRYPSGNKEWKEKVEDAAKNALSNGVADILYPVEPNEYASMYGVEQIEPGIGGAQMIRELIEGFFLRKIKKYILGQLLTSEAESTGMGSGVADAHLATFSDIVQYDAFNLQETLTEQLVRKLQKENAPKSMGVYLRLLLDTDTPDTERRLSAIQAAYQMDVPIKVEDIYQLTGITKPEPKDEIISVSLQQEKQQKQQNEMMMEQQAMMGGMGEEAMPEEAAIPEEEEQPVQEAMDVSPDKVSGVEGPSVPADGELDEPNGKWDGFFESLFRALREGDADNEYVETHTIQETEDGQQEAFAEQDVDGELTEQFSNLFDCYLSHGMCMAEFKHDLASALEKHNLASELTDAMDRHDMAKTISGLFDRHSLANTMAAMLDERVNGASQVARDELVAALNARFGQPERYTRGWAPYRGPRRGKGWKNIMTGEVRYQSDMPSDSGAKKNGYKPIRPKKSGNGHIKTGKIDTEPSKGWVGFDLDGTLAEEPQGEYDPHVIGDPIPKMVKKAKKIMDHGVEVRVVTARVAEGHDDENIARKAIHKWTEEVFGNPLRVQAHKDPHMVKLFDNKVVRVETNTGEHTDPDDEYSMPSDSISAEKAEEMLENPPHGKELTDKQKRMLHAAADKYTLTASDIAEAVKDWQPPSDAQKEAGNYTKPKVQWKGLTISIEVPRGERRNPEWKPLAHHYGYFNRSESADGEQVDVFVADDPDSDIVFVVDQEHPSGRFDEHKVVVGCHTEDEARAAYLDNYDDGWHCGPITSMTVPQFKAWLEHGDTTTRVAEQVSKYMAAYAADPERYARKKSSPGQKTFDFDALHPRGQPNNAGQFVEKHEAAKLAHHGHKPATGAEKKAYAEYEEFVKEGGAKPKGLDEWLHLHRAAEALNKHKEKQSGESLGAKSDTSGTETVPIDEGDRETVSPSGVRSDGDQGDETEPGDERDRVRAADKLPGGAADNAPDEEFDQDALTKGTEHEMEHTDDPTVAKEVAKDHLKAEGEDYYDKLEAVEGNQRPPVPKGMDPVQYRKGQADAAIGLRNPSAAGLKEGSLPWKSWLAGYDSMTKEPSQEKEPDPIEQIVQRVLDNDENVLNVIGDMGYTGKDKIDMYRKAREAVSAARTAKEEAEMSPGRRRARDKQREINPERHSLQAVHDFAANLYLNYYSPEDA